MAAGLTWNIAYFLRACIDSRKIGARLRDTLGLARAHRLEVTLKNISWDSKNNRVATWVISTRSSPSRTLRKPVWLTNRRTRTLWTTCTIISSASSKRQWSSQLSSRCWARGWVSRGIHLLRRLLRLTSASSNKSWASLRRSATRRLSRTLRRRRTVQAPRGARSRTSMIPSGHRRNRLRLSQPRWPRSERFSVKKNSVRLPSRPS